MGSIEGKNYNDITLQAENNATINNSTYTITLNAELSQKPSADMWLDMNISAPGASGLPAGMNGATPIGEVQISYPSDSDLATTSGSVELTFMVPEVQNSGLSTIYYLVDYDGSTYTIQNATMNGTNGSVTTFEAQPSLGTGIYTLLEVPPTVNTPTPSPTPLAANLTGSSPTTGPSTNSSSSLPTSRIYELVALIGVIAIIVVGALFLVFKR
jgi:hypothetical protein